MFFFFSLGADSVSPPPPTAHLNSLHTSPVSLFFPPRTWSTATAGLRPHLPLPPLTPLTPLASLTFTSSQQSQQQQHSSSHQPHHLSLTAAAAAAALRQRIVRPSHRPAHCPACGRYFTFGHNMKAHLKRCPKNANRIISSASSTTSCTTLSTAISNVLRGSPPSRRSPLSPPTLLRASSPLLGLPIRLPLSPPPLPLLAFTNHRLDQSSSPHSATTSSPSPNSLHEHMTETTEKA